MRAVESNEHSMIDELAEAVGRAVRQALEEIAGDTPRSPADLSALVPQIVSRAVQIADDPRIKDKWLRSCLKACLPAYHRAWFESQSFVKRMEKERDAMLALVDLYEVTALTVVDEDGNGSRTVGAYTEEEWDRADALLRQIRDDGAILSDEKMGDELSMARDAMREMVEQLRGEHERARPLVEEVKRQRREDERRERIAAHRTPDVVMEGTRCVSCGKKPARVDDLCKRCAHAQGVLPRGKIGGA